MGAGRAGTVVEIAGDAVFVVMMLVAMAVGVFAGMDVVVAVFAAVAVVMAVGMRADWSGGVAVGVFVFVVMPVIVRMGMHRAVLMDVRVFMLPFDLRFPRAAAANCTHIRLLITRFLFP
jgi:hypothetical protein